MFRLLRFVFVHFLLKASPIVLRRTYQAPGTALTQKSGEPEENNNTAAAQQQQQQQRYNSKIYNHCTRENDRNNR